MSLRSTNQVLQVHLPLFKLWLPWPGWLRIYTNNAFNPFVISKLFKGLCLSQFLQNIHFCWTSSLRSFIFPLTSTPPASFYFKILTSYDWMVQHLRDKLSQCSFFSFYRDLPLLYLRHIMALCADRCSHLNLEASDSSSLFLCSLTSFLSTSLATLHIWKMLEMHCHHFPCYLKKKKKKNCS